MEIVHPPDTVFRDTGAAQMKPK